MESRALIEELLQLQAATSIVPPPTLLQTQFDNLTQGSSTSLFPAFEAARSLYTSPSNVNLTISTPSLTNPTSTTNGRQIILDIPLCYNQTHHHHQHNQLPRNQSFTQESNGNARRVPYPTNRPRIANSSTFNQLKDTVVRVQQRKRQREAAAAAEAQRGISEAPVPDTTNVASSSSTESSSAAKIRRRDSVVQNQQQEGTSDAGSSSSTSDRRCVGNQQITGPVRQHESRNCHYCNGTPQVITRREVAPMYTPNDVIAVSAAAAAAAAATVMGPFMRTPQPVAPPTTVLYPVNNQVRLLQESIMNNHVNQQYQYIMPTLPMQTSGVYVFPGPPPHLRDLTYMFNFIQADGLLRDRGTIDRHHMFTTADDMPIGVTLQDIEKHTEKIVFEKNEKEEEKDATREADRCTVCLCDFEGGKEVRKLQCAHIFHPECIDRWLAYNKKCPVCRMEVDKNSTESSPTTSGQPTVPILSDFPFPTR